jgi:proline dehydrogenase
MIEAVFDLFNNNLINKSKESKFNLLEYICKSQDIEECLKSILNIFNIESISAKNLIIRVKKLEVDLRKVIDHSKKLETSVMIDAEQTYLQVSIDYLVYYLMKEYNTNSNCILLNTIQMYLKDSGPRLKSLFKYCKENNITTGVKIVRGAYMNEERKLANKNNYPDPICEDQSKTDSNYSGAVVDSLSEIEKNDKVIFATHNYATIQLINQLDEIINKDKEKNNKKPFIVAQLMGIGQHAAWLSHEKFVS